MVIYKCPKCGTTRDKLVSECPSCSIKEEKLIKGVPLTGKDESSKLILGDKLIEEYKEENKNYVTKNLNEGGENE